MSSATFQSIDPTTGEHVRTFYAQDDGEIQHTIDTTWEGHIHLKAHPIKDRADRIAEIGDRLRHARRDIAAMMTTEMGKPGDQSLAEVDKCIWLCEHYSRNAASSLEAQTIRYEDIRVIRRNDPLGIIFGIMPWNFPIWQTLRYAIPSLLTGNGVLLKPAPNVIGCSSMLRDCIADAFEGPAPFGLLVIDVDKVERVIADSHVRGVTLTGSGKAGSAVAALAGKYLKPSVLELGGSDPFIVLDDADVQAAGDAFVKSRMNNTGQTCIAAKRAIVHGAVYDEFVEHTGELISSLKVGNPQDPDTDISCIARDDLTDALMSQLQRGAGSAREIQAAKRRGSSNFVTPGLYEVNDRDNVLWREEIFGPVCIVTACKNDEHAVELANDTCYGLGCGIWTADESRGIGLAEKIDAGSLHINRIVSSDPRVPFGGVKESGYGRELGSEGLWEFSNRKYITIDQ